MLLQLLLLLLGRERVLPCVCVCVGGSPGSRDLSARLLETPPSLPPCTLSPPFSLPPSADLAVDMGRNVIHGSDSVNSAMREVALWFRADELAAYTPATSAWVYE